MAKSMTTEEQIAHFLKLAEDPGATQEERDTAGQRAERLMVKHGIDRATAEAHGAPVTERIVTEQIFFGGAYAKDRMHAATAVARALKLRPFYSDARGTDASTGKVATGVRLSVVGFESDVADAMQLIRSLDVQAAVGAADYMRPFRRNTWYTAAEKAVMKRSYISSFGSGAARRIEEARSAEVATAGGGTALVLADRAQRVQAYDLGFRLRNARSRGRLYDGAAGAAGRAAGYNAATGGRGLGAGQLSLSR